jgi:hypothetical protein
MDIRPGVRGLELSMTIDEMSLLRRLAHLTLIYMATHEECLSEDAVIVLSAIHGYHNLEKPEKLTVSDPHAEHIAACFRSTESFLPELSEIGLTAAVAIELELAVHKADLFIPDQLPDDFINTYRQVED